MTNLSKHHTKKFVLQFAESSNFAGELVTLDYASGGYPATAYTTMQAKTWDTKEEAQQYASMFTPESKSYSAYAIDPEPLILEVTVRKETQANDLD